jgi:ribonuclease BN (tRNA processing enzyme)
MPTDPRETSCLFVRNGRNALTIDAGTGFRRLVTDPELLDGIDRLAIVLTHFHLDHTIGLAYLPGLEVPVELWAPGRAVNGTPALDLVRRLLDPPFLLKEPEDLWKHVEEVRELETPETSIGPFDVGVRVQSKHAAPTLALRFGDAFAYCTDTARDEANIEFVRGARVLFHEAFFSDDTTDDDGHTAAGDAARVAAAAGVERLVLVHVNPTERSDDDLLRAARRHFPATELGRDGLALDLS